MGGNLADSDLSESANAALLCGFILCMKQADGESGRQARRVSFWLYPRAAAILFGGKAGRRLLPLAPERAAKRRGRWLSGGKSLPESRRGGGEK